MTCAVCGAPVRRVFVGSIETVAHLSAKQNSHYPRVDAPKGADRVAPALRSATSAAPAGATE